MAELDTVVLRDPESAMTATFVPGAGMIRHLARRWRSGVSRPAARGWTYLTNAKTMGIPLLYPWANRLDGNTYDVDGGVVTLTPGRVGYVPTRMAHPCMARSPPTRAG